MLKIKYLFVLVAFLFTIQSPILAHENPTLEIRAALDIGSGATKLRVAEVDTTSQKIQKILFDDFFEVGYQEDLEQSKDGRFSSEVMKQGIEAMRESRRIAKSYGADRVVAIATAAFRNATNADLYIRDIYCETGVEVIVIDQDLEGKLAFQATQAKVPQSADQLVVWDIGGGSLQLTMKDGQDDFQIYRGQVASVPFKNYIVESIQKKDLSQVKTPNPLSAEQIQASKAHAQTVASDVSTPFMKRLQNPEVTVVGVGSIFGIRMADVMDGKTTFTREQLKEKVSQMAGQTDDHLGNPPFVEVAISNPILILGFMEKLGIDKVTIVDVNNSDGAMVYQEYWGPGRTKDPRFNESVCRCR